MRLTNTHPYRLGWFVATWLTLISTGLQSQVVDANALPPQEHLNAAKAAYDSGDWPKAETLFDSFIKTFDSVPELAETIRSAKPLLVVSRLRQKKYAETLELLELVIQDPKLDPVAADELTFWRGICHLQLDDYAKARLAFGEYYGEKQAWVVKLQDGHRATHAGRRVESIILYGSCFMAEGDFISTAKFFGEQIPALRQLNREAAGRATVLRLYALIESQDDAAALQLIKDTQLRMDEITQVVAFHSLSLQLGAKFLDDLRYYDAITCLQRIWTRDRLVNHQRLAQETFVNRLQVVRTKPGQEYLTFQYEGLLTRIQRELDTFEKIPNFDSALRLRLATAYKELQRYREAALILEDMLERMAPDPIVEKATLALIQCWMRIERWPKAVAAADQYLINFKRKDNTDIPMVRFLRASALHGDHQSHEAELAFASVHQLHPTHELAANSLFMEGICLLEQDLNLEAMDAFADVAKRFPADPIAEDCFYWTGMALSFEKRHAEARQQMQSYLKRYTQNPRYTAEASFRVGFCTFGLADYPRAIKELEAFIRANPSSALAEEAKLLLGDALAAEGQLDPAIAIFLKVDRSLSRKFYEEAQFRIGNIYKVSEQPEKMREHYELFAKANPSSQRIAEAIYWVGSIHMSAGRIEEARQAYWDSISQHGDNASSRGVEDILLALPKVYPGDEGRIELHKRLDEVANNPERTTLALRAKWAKASLINKPQPAQARELLLSAKQLLDVREHSAQIAADIADALRESDQLPAAKELYIELRKWHPRAMEKDRAYFGLGMIALAGRQEDEAMKWFARFEKETLGSGLLANVAEIKADLFATDRKYAEAQKEYERIIEMPTAGRQTKARMLLKLGDLMTTQREDKKATAYYERVYVSYAKYRPEVASAYSKRAAALQRLGLTEKATEVYAELALREDLATLPEAIQAVSLLNKQDPEWRVKRLKTEGGSTP